MIETQLNVTLDDIKARSETHWIAPMSLNVNSEALSTYLSHTFDNIKNDLQKCKMVTSEETYINALEYALNDFIPMRVVGPY
jgi:3-hydroxy-3-methylglutaryl CoA synthase